MRTERIAAYRSLSAAAGNTLLFGMLAITPGGDEEQASAAHYDRVWSAALAEVQMVGAQAVLDVAQAIENMRKDRVVMRAMQQYQRDHATTTEASPEDQFNVQMEQFDRLFNENTGQLVALIDACRADIASLQD